MSKKWNNTERNETTDMPATAYVKQVVGSKQIKFECFGLAADRMQELLFEQKIPPNQIGLEVDVYAHVAMFTGKQISTIAQAVGRASHLFWKLCPIEELEKIIGKPLDLKEDRISKDEPPPSTMLYKIACYTRCHKPYCALPDDLDGEPIKEGVTV